MTRDETKELLMMVQAAYPNFKPPDKTTAVNMWFVMLKDYDFKMVQAGLKAYIATDASGFAPAIGQIIGKIQDIVDKPSMIETEAWAIVSKAIRNGTYHSVDEFAKLPPEIKRAVGTPEQLFVWATDEEYNEQVVSSNFMRSYRQVVAQKRDFEKLPSDIRKMVEAASNELLEDNSKK